MAGGVTWGAPDARSAKFTPSAIFAVERAIHLPRGVRPAFNDPPSVLICQFNCCRNFLRNVIDTNCCAFIVILTIEKPPHNPRMTRVCLYISEWLSNQQFNIIFTENKQNNKMSITRHVRD
jgi:hypothetical protein